MRARTFTTLALVAVLGLGLAACGDTTSASGGGSTDGGASPEGGTTGYANAGFEVFEKDGRLWVFRADSDDLKTFKEHGEPAKSVTSIGTGPNGMSVRSGDMDTIKAYLAAK